MSGQSLDSEVVEAIPTDEGIKGDCTAPKVSLVSMPMIVNSSGRSLECGVDEAGRGSFFGRLYVGAVIFPVHIELDPSIVKDSKRFTSHRRRKEARDYILERALYTNVAYAEPDAIDRYGIQSCLYRTMHLAIEGLGVKPEHLLIDGDRFEPYQDIPYELKIKGDANYFSIAAASILAKVAHDEHILEMLDQHGDLEIYDLRKNMGYGTAKHRDALKQHGVSQFHRKTFCEKTLGQRPTLGSDQCLI